LNVTVNHAILSFNDSKITWVIASKITTYSDEHEANENKPTTF